jgi:hypothetical protein
MTGSGSVDVRLRESIASENSKASTVLPDPASPVTTSRREGIRRKEFTALPI